MRYLFIVLTTFLLLGTVPAAAKRVALVIGNDTYESVPKLQKAVNDARAVSQSLARLDFAVYESLLDLAVKTAAELAELKPKDRIDVQSFIWVVGDYKDAQHAEIAAVREKL